MNINYKSIDLTITFCLVALVMTLFPNIALAAEDNEIELVLCRIVSMLTGTAGKAIATIAIVVLGIGLFMGKISWPVAAATALGVGMIFGAANLVGWLSDSKGGGACSSAAGSGG